MLVIDSSVSPTEVLGRHWSLTRGPTWPAVSAYHLGSPRGRDATAHATERCGGPSPEPLELPCSLALRVSTPFRTQSSESSAGPAVPVGGAVGGAALPGHPGSSSCRRAAMIAINPTFPDIPETFVSSKGSLFSLYSSFSSVASSTYFHVLGVLPGFVKSPRTWAKSGICPSQCSFRRSVLQEVALLSRSGTRLMPSTPGSGVAPASWAKVSAKSMLSVMRASLRALGMSGL